MLKRFFKGKRIKETPVSELAIAEPAVGPLQLELQSAVDEKRKTTRSCITPDVLDHLDAMRVMTASKKNFYLEIYPKVDSWVREAVVYAKGALNASSKNRADEINVTTSAAKGAVTHTTSPGVMMNVWKTEMRGMPTPETKETLENKIRFIKALN